MAYVQLSDGCVIETASPEHWKDATPLSKAKGKAAIAEQAKQHLLKILKPGDTVHCVVRHVSSSGMSRYIDFFKLDNGEMTYLSGYIGSLLGYGFGKNDRGLKVSGCGMDMGFAVVYELSRKLFQGNFECIGEKCPSNDHSNGDRNREPHQHSDGGYALRHAWI